MINLYIYFFYMMLLSMFFFIMSLYVYYLDLSIIMEWLLLSVNSLNMEMLILLDWVSCLFMSVVLMISSMIMLYIMVYMESDKNIDRFIKLVNLFVLSMILMIISPNLISILFGWDGLGLSSYCLIIYYQNYMSFNSGMITVLCNRLGDVGLLMTISLVFMYGSWNMNFSLEKKKLIIMFMIMLAAMTKSAQIPFSVWLPLAMAAPTPVSALVHSSTLVTAGVYLLFRFNKFLIKLEISKFMLYISVYTMFMAGLMANFEMDLKKIIALSTLSQLGLMMMILSLGVKFLAFYHLLTHAVFKSLLFMCAGIMIHFMDNNQDIRFYGKLNEYIPFTMMSFYISSLALMGVPFLSGFYSKDLIMEVIYMMEFNLFIMIFIVLSVMFTVSYSLRLIYYIYFSEFKGISLNFIKESLLMNISMIMLLLMSIFSGSMFFWVFFFDKYFIYLNLKMKMLTFMFMIMGLFFMKLLYMKNLFKFYILIYFFSSMWMMNFMFLGIYEPIMKLGVKFFKLDMEWMEFIEKDMILKFMEVLKLNNNLLKMNMFLFIVSMTMFIIFFFM